MLVGLYACTDKFPDVPTKLLKALSPPPPPLLATLVHFSHCYHGYTRFATVHFVASANSMQVAYDSMTTHCMAI